VTVTPTSGAANAFTVIDALPATMNIGAIQLEQGSFASTFIPTTGSPVTRPADNATFTSGVLSSGTIFFIGNNSTWKQSTRPWHFTDGSGELAWLSQGGLVSGIKSAYLAFTGGLTASPTGYTAAVSWDGTSRVHYLNGALDSTFADTNVPTGSILFPGDGNSGFETYDHSTFITFHRALTITEIQLLHTTVQGNGILDFSDPNNSGLIAAYGWY